MTRRAKLELLANQPVEVQLLFNEPIVGNSKYGEYYLYAISVNEMEYCFFPDAEIHNQIKDFKKGDRFVITKLSAVRGEQTLVTYEIKPIPPSEKEVRQNCNSETPSDIQEHDKYFYIMRKSYLDAMEIAEEINGLADIERIAITLFISRSKQTNRY